MSALHETYIFKSMTQYLSIEVMLFWWWNYPLT